MTEINVVNVVWCVVRCPTMEAVMKSVSVMVHFLLLLHIESFVLANHPAAVVRSLKERVRLSLTVTAAVPFDSTSVYLDTWQRFLGWES